MLLLLPPFLIKGSTNQPNENHLRLPLPPSLSTSNWSPILMDPRSGMALPCRVSPFTAIVLIFRAWSVSSRSLRQPLMRPHNFQSSPGEPPCTAQSHPLKHDSESATFLFKNFQGFTKPPKWSLFSLARKAHHDPALPTCPAPLPTCPAQSLAISQQSPSQQAAAPHAFHSSTP